MRIPSRQFVVIASLLLVVQLVLFVTYWYGDTIEQRGFRGPEHINATFANYYFEYEILTYLNPDRCFGKKLFIFIMSSTASFQQRDVIRRTWAAKKHIKESLVVFIVGRPHEADHHTKLMEENRQYGDIIQTTIPDTYNYTAFKIHAGYVLHVNHCFNVPFVLRADDDVIVLPDRFVHFINNGYLVNEDKAIYGIVLVGGKPVRDPKHKWYIPKDYYTPEEFPPYMNGPAYLMTRNSTKAILEKTNETTFFWIEDVMFTGIMANKTGVKQINAQGMFLYHCDLQDEAGRRAFDSWNGAGYCLRNSSSCDSSGVPYVCIINHSPDAPRSDMFRGYDELTSVQCDPLSR
uniref:Hexosyltransferase n=1 Tax=Steinernema glaseri TaxID=37863 RepID=A0A1I8ANT5_9BILA